jgi:hypothetical protein
VSLVIDLAVLTVADVQAQGGNAKDTFTWKGNDQNQAPQMNQPHQQLQ